MVNKTKKNINSKKKYLKKKQYNNSGKYSRRKHSQVGGKQRNSSQQTGGKVLASGGYGCIFKPALKCKNVSERPSGQISKLMTTKHAKSEYNEIMRFKHILQKIPNYSNYFLVDNVTLCEPDKLTSEDLEKYTEKCKALKKDNITEGSINSRLGDVLSLNMPFGGKDVSDYIKEYTDYNSFYTLNNSLIDLLVHGIVPMNKLNVFHGDIKESNILVSNSDSKSEKSDSNTNKKMNARLIDWGLSTIYKGEKELPKGMYRRPFQYNVPFSVILFNKDFLKAYQEFLHNIPHTRPVSYFDIREFVVNFIYSWSEIRGPGHIKLINDINSQLVNGELTTLDSKAKEKFTEYSFTYYYIIEYLTKVILAYTHNGKIHITDYFKNVYIKNTDVWGFVMVYSSILEEMFNRFDKLNGKELLIYDKLKYLIIHFLFEDPLKVIDINELVKELHNLGQILKGNNETSLLTYHTLSSMKKVNTNNNGSLLDSIKLDEKR